jgi:hypothetical protein
MWFYCVLGSLVLVMVWSMLVMVWFQCRHACMVPMVTIILYIMYASMYGDGHILLNENMFQNNSSGLDIQPDSMIGLLGLAVMMSLAYR